MSKKRKYTPEQRQAIVAEALTNGVKETAAKHGINYRLIHNWKNEGALEFRAPIVVTPAKRLYAVESDNKSTKLAPYEPPQEDNAVVLNCAESVKQELLSIENKIQFLENELTIYKDSILNRLHNEIHESLKHRHIEMLSRSHVAIERIMSQIRCLERDRTTIIAEHLVVKDVTEARITQNTYLARLCEMILQHSQRQLITDQPQDVEVVA